MLGLHLIERFKSITAFGRTRFDFGDSPLEGLDEGRVFDIFTIDHLPEPLVELGRIRATPNALAKLSQGDILTALERHQAGDWGDLCEEDRRENQLSLEKGFRLFSAYHAKNGTKFWIITEADRRATTVLLPKDY